MSRSSSGTEPLEVRLDYERVKLIQPAGSATSMDDRYENQGKEDSPLSFRLPVKAGPRLLGISFVSDMGHRLAIDARPPRPSIKSFFFQQYPRDPQVLGVQIVGPFDASRRDGYAEPPPDSRLSAGHGGRRRALRTKDSDDPGASRVSGHRNGWRYPEVDGPVQDGPQQGRFRNGDRVGARGPSRPDAISLPGRA